MAYYTIVNNNLLIAEKEVILTTYYDNVYQLPSDYVVNKYVVKNNELVINPNYETEQTQKERERIAMLNMTGADVERGIYKAKGMDFEDIIALVEKLAVTVLNEETGEVIHQGVDIDVKALKIELKANDFYRGNPYVDAVGSLLGFTKEQMDAFFETKDYTALIS